MRAGLRLGETGTRRIDTIAPTVLTDLPAGAAVMQEEIFGPILPVVGYQTMEEAVAFIRKRPKPLALYLFTRDRSLQATNRCAT